MNSTKALHERQKAADLAHHKANVAWLEQPRPTWADGTPVAPSMVTTLLRLNRASIEHIERHGMSTGGAGPVE